jgi:SH3-like domain-containing protein
MFGYLLTSMTMVGNYFGGNETPASFNEKMRQKGGFQNQWVRPAAGARAKIGQHDEWMHVRDIEGDEGYVAAWYVTPVDDPSLGVQKEVEEADRPTPRTKLVVKTTTEDVALRTQPQVAEETLVKRLPHPSELLVIESGDAEQKIGIYDQWLQVRALDGTEGYVAAWYATRG